MQTIRFQQVEMPGYYTLYHWQQGDCVRREQYWIPGGGKPDELREQTTITFNSHVDPLSALPLYNEFTTQPSTHYTTGTTTNLYRDGVSQPYTGCVTNSSFDYDEKGRLRRMRYNTGNEWEYFTYAP